MMRKTQTVQIREEIYYLLVSRRIFPAEKKVLNKGARGTGDSQHIDKHILKTEKLEGKL